MVSKGDGCEGPRRRGREGGEKEDEEGGGGGDDDEGGGGANTCTNNFPCDKWIRDLRRSDLNKLDLYTQDQTPTNQTYSHKVRRIR